MTDNPRMVIISGIWYNYMYLISLNKTQIGIWYNYIYLVSLNMRQLNPSNIDVEIIVPSVKKMCDEE